MGLHVFIQLGWARMGVWRLIHRLRLSRRFKPSSSLATYVNYPKENVQVIDFATCREATRTDCLRPYFSSTSLCIMHAPAPFLQIPRPFSFFLLPSHPSSFPPTPVLTHKIHPTKRLGGRREKKKKKES